jgi:hypothetical protein
MLKIISIFPVMPKTSNIFHKIAKFSIGMFFILLAACSTAYNLTDRSGNVFVVESPELETNKNMEYRAGDAIRELKIKDIVSLSVPNAEPKIFDGKVFYPATLALEDSVSVPSQGFICVEGTMIAKNAGAKFKIPVANIKEFSRKVEKQEEAQEKVQEGIQEEKQEQLQEEK